MNEPGVPTLANAEPTKDFFVSMITRDISLEDCILDLLDNCIDGARKTILARKPDSAEMREWLSASNYDGFWARITCSRASFEISDNCGGISLDDAVNYALRFGRRRDADPTAGGIGLYGIGLKRAVFKIGRSIRIESTHRNHSFSVPINVDEWLERPSWDFDLEASEHATSEGTRVLVERVYDEVGSDFEDEVFRDALSKAIARDYSFILRKGFVVFVNDRPIEPHSYVILEGGPFEPVRQLYTVGEVSIEIVAGMTVPPPDEVGPSERSSRDVEYSGWFVACNDRVVLAADKTDRTVWGDDDFPAWHYQYNGFTGIIWFHAVNPQLLPWTTTKREVDQSSDLYRDAVARMKAATRPYLSYTAARRANLEEAKELEAAAISSSRLVTDLPERSAPSYPTFIRPSVATVMVQYRATRALVEAVAVSLGNKRMPATQVGRKTFDYYVEQELGEREGAS